jgi:hypothetical protein
MSSPARHTQEFAAQAEEIRERYNVNEAGVIDNPGKFEGELIYVPFFWELGLEGSADAEEMADDEQESTGADDSAFVFALSLEDHELWPELPDRAIGLRLYENTDGFVFCDVKQADSPR